MKPIKKIAFIINIKKTGASALAEKLINKVKEEGCSVSITDTYPAPNDFLKGSDICCVIGGDGTLLGAVNESVSNQVPVFGVNLGKLGFLATFNAEEALEKLPSLIQGNYNVNYRTLLHCSDQINNAAIALNDIVIKQSSSSQLMHIIVHCNNELVTSYYCDGLIFATPTGSTAYNLSAGGPIISPSSNSFAMTPICPHTLSNRTVIFDQNDVITISIEAENFEILVTYDGHIHHSRQICNFPLKIKIAEPKLPLLQPIQYSHFKILRSKLKWGD